MIVRKRGDWLVAKVGDEVVMMSADKGSYIGLTEVGARIWELIDAPRPVDSIYACLMEEFEVAPDVCQSDVDEFLNDLEGHGAIAFDTPPVA